jgi:GMP synthase-like glutamine amidotransferase
MLETSKLKPLSRTGEVSTGSPREYYTSDEWFEREIQLIFSCQ